MAEKLPVPNITIDENSTDYAVKMQQIADGQKTSIEAFNAQIDAGILAEEATSKIVQEKATATAEIDNTVATAKVDIAVAQNSIEKAKKDVVSVLTGGTATLEPEAGKIPLADADGVIDSKWIPASLTGQNAFAIKRDSNKDKYAASGMVHMGKHGSFSINEGLYVSNTVPNAVLLGRYDSNNPSGASKSDVAVAVIAGIETTLDRLNVNGNYHAATIKLPDAPDGTVTLNRETGAVTQHASAAEAFGGIVSNGDFRHGTDNWNFLNASMVIGSDGWATITTTAGYGRAAINMPTVLGEEYRLEAVIENTGDDLLLELAGAGIILTKNHLDAGIQTVTYHFTADAAVTTLRCQVQEAVGGSIRVNFVSVMPVAEEVVTERVDMYGLEAFLEEITVENPFVYPNGLIQSQAATMDGVATAFSNRPMTYYAAFGGDIGSPGKGVNWFASNDIDKGKLCGNPKNEIHWIDGKLYQWHVRQKTFAGAGNGDWYNIDTTIAQTLTSTNNPLNRVVPQGGLDEPPAAGGNNYFSAYGNSNYNELPEKGLFTARNGAVGAFGHCYFLVMGTVPRLNQGAFFHGLNDFGARPFRFSQSNPTFLGPWSVSSVNIYCKAQCFDLKSSSDAGNGALGASDYGGKIGTTSGRPDGRFYDAIYSGGLGGVIDYRLPAWDKSSAEEAAKVDVKVKSGAYRGLEKLRRTKVKKITVANSQSGNLLWTGTSNTGQDANSGFISLGMPAADAKLIPGTRIHAISGTVVHSGYVGEWQYNSTGNHYVRVIFDNWTSSQTVVASDTNTFVVIEENTNISVSGNFLKTDILANPINIFTSSKLQQGWLGSWLGFPLSAINHNAKLSRKVVESLVQPRVWSEDNGTTWSSATSILDAVSNTMFADNTHDVTVLSYYAFAKQTKQANNESVFNGDAGVGKVFVSQSHEHSVFFESLIGKVITAPYDSTHSSSFSMISLSTNSANKLQSLGIMRNTKHQALDLIGYDTPSAKVLNYQIENKQQLGISYIYEELKYSEDWGDDGIMSINSGQTTNTDNNTTTVLTGTSALALSYGWSKNNV